MKRIYSLYFTGVVLLIVEGFLLVNPPTTVYACTGSAQCQYGENVVIPPGATSCDCTDNLGCSWIINGKKYSQKCAVKGDDGFLPLEGPVN